MCRGVRLRPEADGAGIGLALVEETMTLYGGALTPGRGDLGGLAASLAFGPVSSRTAPAVSAARAGAPTLPA